MAEAALGAEAGRVWKEGLHLGLDDAIALAFGAPREVAGREGDGDRRG